MYVIQVNWCGILFRYIDNPKYRRDLCQFRVSSHVLELEQGRYHGNLHQENNDSVNFAPEILWKMNTIFISMSYVVL